ncbi:DinB/UmuC family translesion DNA polymerase [Bacillus sp. 123MFChir2]|uniref:DinB/UmuC family translesion DNA polymerase n=1 Tax=Bacillus sp. 123MFChir2 TaxID=1169144 RepID=UPI00036DB119|nr:hypothetical protein [Bacillus sp. 123MFChir2]
MNQPPGVQNTQIVRVYRVCLRLLKQLHTGEPIRTVSIALTNLVNEGEEQISPFDDIQAREREIILAKTVSYSPTATGRYRNTLIGNVGVPKIKGRGMVKWQPFFIKT